MSSPSKLFCQILNVEYKRKIDIIESLLYLPLRAVSDVKNNLSRVEKLVYYIVKAEVLKLEKIIIEILLLDKVSELEGIDNFCKIAWNCSALIQLLTSDDNGYTDFLPDSVRNQIATNYDLFEKNICRLGLMRLVTDFTDSSLQTIRDTLVELKERLDDELRLDEIRATYIEILNTDIYGDKNIIELLDDLRVFLNCAFGICNFAESSNNALNNYMEKLVLSDTGTTFTENIDSLLTDYNLLNDEIEDKIDELISLIDNRNLSRGINRDEIMVI